MNARDYQAKSVDELKTWLDTTIGEDFHPTLAIVFTSQHERLTDIGQAFDQHGVAVFGASSWGEFTRGGIELDSISVLLLDIQKDSFYLRLDHLEGGDEETTTETVVRQALDRFDDPVIMLLISDLRTRGEAILKTFELLLGPTAQVAGAGAGNTSISDPSHVFTATGISSRGMLTLVMDGSRVGMVTRAACGWQAIGTPKIITRSEGEWIYEIDGAPALDAILKYIGKEDLDLDDPVQWEVEVNTLPLQLQRPEGDPIMRPALLYDKETRAVMCTGKMEEGAEIRFSIEPDDGVIDAVLEDFAAFKDEAGDLDAVVYFSCWGRYNALGPAMNREIREAGKLFDVPMVGLLSSGEMARATGGNLEFNALTSCCVLLKEVEG